MSEKPIRPRSRLRQTGFTEIKGRFDYDNPRPTQAPSPDDPLSRKIRKAEERHRGSQIVEEEF